jgi:hypothetical protein
VNLGEASATAATILGLHRTMTRAWVATRLATPEIRQFVRSPNILVRSTSGKPVETHVAPTLRHRQGMISAACAPTAMQLPADTSVFRVAAACRNALLLFVGQSGKWGKRELAEWLMNHYAKAVCLDEEPAPSERKPSQSVEPEALQWLLRAARVEVIQCAEELLEHGEDAPFLSRVADHGYVVPVRDAAGAEGFVPITKRAMTFADRVVSLLAADFLTLPDQYRSSPRRHRSGAPPRVPSTG